MASLMVKWDSFKTRLHVLKPRMEALAKKYPIVAAAMVTIGAVLGYVVGKFL